MRRPAIQTQLIIPIALVVMAGVAGPTTWAQSQSAGTSKKQVSPPARVTTQVKEENVDLVPDIKDKTFSDGKHLIRTLPSGLRISIITKNNRILEVLFTDKDGKEEKGKPKESSAPVESKRGAPTQTGTPKTPCTQIVCHGSTTKVIGTDGQIESETTTNTCVRVPCPITANPFENDPPSGAGSGTPQQKKADAKPPVKKP